MNPLELRVQQRQQHTMSPRLQRAVRLLQMSSLDFVTEVRATMGRNPFLDSEDDGIDGLDGELHDGAGLDGDVDGDVDGDGHGDREPVASLDRNGDGIDGDSPDADTHDTHDTHDTLQATDTHDGAADGGDGLDGWHVEAGTRVHADAGSSMGIDGDEGGNDWIVAPTTLADHLCAQLNVLPLPLRDLTLARAVVDSLDDDGYLRGGLDEIAAGLALDPPADADELQIALCRVQALDPAGVGARSASECLLLQLAQQQRDAESGKADACNADGSTADKDRAALTLAELIVRDHLQALASLGIARLARRLRVNEAAVERACKRIRALDPHPGWRFGGNQAQYITPDVIVRKQGTRWVAALNQRVVPRLRLNETYAELFTRHRSAGHGELAAQLQEARWTLSNVQQRFATILAVSQAIVDRQGQFLDYGPMAMRPMCLREIADEVGAHPSTICRATNNKYMSTPAGVFELKHFFSRALPTTAGGSCSPTAIKGLMRDMFDAENPRSPLTDAQIARQLVDQGLPIVRRTVTKYRQALLVDVARRRQRSA